MALDSFFRDHPVFTAAEVHAYLTEHGTGNQRTHQAALTYHRGQGHILSLRRGLYMVVPPGTTAADAPVDAYLLASRLTPDAVIAYHSALEFHGRAYSTSQRIVYLTTHRAQPFTFRGTQYRSVEFPAALTDQRQQDFGVQTMERMGLPIRVTSLERTLVDVLDRPRLAGSWEEIWRSLASVEYYDLDLVVRYTLLLGNATTTAKVGYFLSQYREQLMVTEEHLHVLRAKRPQKAHYLIRADRSGGRLIAEWNLVVPDEIDQRSWAEVT